jgi:outer membrane receptor protein involved in Fe transport
MGAMQSAALRGTLEWKPNERLSFTGNASYEYSDQNGYAYGRYDAAKNLPDTVSFDGTAFYRRNLLNSGLKIKYAGKGFDVISTTGYQWLKDSMLLDQDFTPNPVFTMNQNQKINAITEEIVARSSGVGNLKWLGGVSGFYQNLDLQSLVTFGTAGVAMIQGFINSSGIPFPLTLTDLSIPVVGDYNMKNYGAAAFLQAGYNNLFIEGLNLSAGLRVDYEKASLEHFTHSVFNYRMQIGQAIRTGTKADTLPHGVRPGKEDIDFMQFLPKFSLQYEKGGSMFYATVSRGYKAGGYNVQMFADLMQGQMRSMTPVDFDFKQATSYKPEFSWNYEIGARFSLKGANRQLLNTGITVFYLDIRNQQIAQWAPGGQGRMIKNAGHSASKGVEIDATYYPFDGMRLGLAYGYTNNKFVEYIEVLSETAEADYKGYYVPFVPGNTVSLNATYTFKLKTCLTDRLILDAQYTGAGKTYWTEDNSVSQKYYSLLHAKLTAEKGSVSLSIWGRNLFDTRYTTFYFNTFGNAFGQLGKPSIFGADLTIKF